MEAFGIRFKVLDQKRFASLAMLFNELKKCKSAGISLEPETLKTLVPEDIKSHFSGPDEEARLTRLSDKPVVIISEPSGQLGATWDFYRVFESVEEGDYDLLECVMIDSEVAEIHIYPFGYPYGGVGPFIALAEAFGFRVLGVNEYGKYQSREELTGADATPNKLGEKPWWKFW